MPGAAFLASAFVTIPLALALFVVGAKLHRRSRIDGKPALLFFAAFWIGMGAYEFAEATWSFVHPANFSPWLLALFLLQVNPARGECI